MKLPLHAHCVSCRHEWVLAWLPMDVELLGRIGQGAACPCCGRQAGIRIWTDENARPQAMPVSDLPPAK